MTTPEVLDRLKGLYPMPEWISYRECWRIDFFVMRCWTAGTGHRRIAHEVKVSRSDFFNDERKPHKHDEARAVSNQFYYVTPEGLIGEYEVPEWAGLMWVKPGRRPTVVKRAPTTEARPYTDQEVVYLARFPFYRERVEEDRIALAQARAELARLKQARYGSGQDNQGAPRVEAPAPFAST